MPEFVPVIDLSTLDGLNGFRLDGIDLSDLSGSAVSAAGDVNGDGFGDILIGAYGVDGGGLTLPGESYVVFGKAAGFAAVFNLASLNGANGFKMRGIDGYDYSGRSVDAAGDVNGDGFGDIIIGAAGADHGLEYSTGESYVVFGKASGFAAALNLRTLNGTNGFRLDGINTNDRSGYAVSAAGDVNGDGFGDIVVAAWRASPGGDPAAGETYVVFGKAAGFGAALDLSALNGTNGFRLYGVDANDRSGRAVSAAGDVNGDGFDDIIIGADGGDPGGDADAGKTYVVFGKATGFAAALDLAALNGSNGFRLDGIDANDLSGGSVSAAGDVNGDGFGDLIVGAVGGNPGGDVRAGESYVVFGRASGFAAAIGLATLNGSNGFRLDGIDANDASGVSVSAAGDVNGDGFGDLIVGARSGDPGGDSGAGESYVVFGKAAGFAAAFDLSALNGDTGFRLDGIDPGDGSGIAVSAAGDVNGDGFDDIVIGAASAAHGSGNNAGESYVVFGHRALVAVSRTGTETANRINGGYGGDTIDGLGGNDTLFGWEGDDLINGGAGADTFTGGGGDDTLVGGSGGDTVSYGTSLARIKLALDGSFAAEGDALSDTLFSIERVTGTAFGDVLRGNHQNNRLIGGAGGDALQGMGGDDTLLGGQGADTLTGGPGNDGFDFTSTSHGGDTIGDFHNAAGDNDSMRFKGAAFGGLAAGALDPSLFLANSTGLAANAIQRFIYETNTGILRYDSNGSGAGGVTVMATLIGLPALTAADIVII